ncbi:unnamed protein product [Polarella glacialis]|uniref:DNA-(apurinic or apyrimidinic site) endonuclease n=1 Tax=Polarella glacialis TaxID=89957 RepID=A0A813D7J5_POLGL|nr:unnamed protein product [Polarella glacialis]
MLVRKPLRPSKIAYTQPALPDSHSSHCDPADRLWHPEGRVILATFESFDLLATYSPNNGTDAPAFVRRAAWDAAMKQDLSKKSRPLVWVGDINCAAEDVDVTHPEWMMQQCYQGDPEDMRGQPGFTLGERRRFRELLEVGRLLDSHRLLHPSSPSGPPPPSGPHFTWRGHPPVHQPVARYHGKGMRIDYSLISEELRPRLAASDILGHGSERHGFMGSDHSPIRLHLRSPLGTHGT